MQDQVNAAPTKRLVAYVLTKDVKLEDAILDLIDNSIDGAKRAGKTKLSGFEVRLNLTKDSFVIEDNCGGIPYELARDYAFRFGRPEDYAPLDGPADVIGNFGVGMKRALLKMGRKILIKSVTPEKYFEIDIDVEKWLKDEKNWTFEFSNVRDEKAAKTGTSITVTELYPGVAEQFGLKQFLANVRLGVEEKQAVPLLQGLNVVIGGIPLSGTDMVLARSKDIIPFYQKTLLRDGDKGTVSLEVYAGIDEPDNDRAGWYVVCNGRTVLRADRSNLTGWGNKLDADKIPGYHHQYARFRGYVVFHSDVPELLPWNTAKSGVDVEHPFYRRALQLMITSMKEVFSFLNRLDRESDEAERPLTEAVEKLKAVPLKKISASDAFTVTVRAKPQAVGQKLKYIRYQRPVDQINEVMRLLDVGEANEAGEKTFDLFYDINAGA